MTELTIREHMPVQWKDPIAIVGFPSIGLVSSIAASFLARSLELEVVGGITSPDFPPYAVVHNGVPLPPVRMYGGERVPSGDGGLDCGGIIVVTSEFVPKVEQHYVLATSLLDWFASKGIGTVVCLDGIMQFESEGQRIVGVGSTADANGILSKYSVERIEDTLVRGTTGVMLYEGARRNMNVIALLSPSRPDMPDPRGAARLMEPLARMLPELKIDTEPLYKEAEEIERRMEMDPNAQGGGNDFLYG